MKTPRARIALAALLLLTTTACEFTNVAYSVLLWVIDEEVGVVWAGAHSQTSLLHAGRYQMWGTVFPEEDMVINKLRATLNLVHEDGDSFFRLRRNLRVNNFSFSKRITFKTDLELTLGESWTFELEAKPENKYLHMADLNLNFTYLGSLQDLEAVDRGELDLDIEFLVEDVEDLVAAGTVSRRQGDAWTSSLQAGRTLLEDGHDVQAMMELMSFMEQVNDAVESGSLSREDAEDLTLLADGIADELMVPAR